MILAAMPKTASTSLIHSLGWVTGRNIFPYIEKKGFISESYTFNELSRYHKSVYIKDHKFYKTLLKSQSIYRDHVLPEKDGFDFLSLNKGIVFLIRTPEHVFDNYKRTANIKHPERLLYELRTMFERYYSLAHEEGNFLLTYENLIYNPKSWIKKILKFWGLKAIQPVKLQKRKYTGVGERRLKR